MFGWLGLYAVDFGVLAIWAGFLWVMFWCDLGVSDFEFVFWLVVCVARFGYLGFACDFEFFGFGVFDCAGFVASWVC